MGRLVIEHISYVKCKKMDCIESRAFLIIGVQVLHLGQENSLLESIRALQTQMTFSLSIITPTTYLMMRKHDKDEHKDLILLKRHVQLMLLKKAIFLCI